MEAGSYSDNYGIVVRSDAAGDTLWQREFHQLGGITGVSNKCMTSDGNGGYLLAGFNHERPHWPTDAVVIKVSSEGEYVGGNILPYGSLNGVYDIIRTADGGYALCGYYGGSSYYELHLIRISSTLLRLSWNRNYPYDGNRFGYSVVETEDHGFCMMGYTHPAEDVRWNYLLFKVDSVGTPRQCNLWNGSMGQTRQYDSRGGRQLHFAGYNESLPDLPSMDWIYKTVPDSLFISSARSITVPVNHELSVFPNPFNNTARINFTIDASAQINLQVFDVLGRRVADLANEVLPAGTHSFSFHGEFLSSGIYFVSLSTPTSIKTTKLVLMK